jgi:aminopeptidase N
MQKLVGLVFLITSISALATDPYPKNNAIDVKHYSFQLEVNDSTNVITGQATISILFNTALTDFELDLVNKNERAEGMEISQIVFGENKLRFLHQHDRIKIFLTTSAKAHEQLTFTIYYKGIPRDGLTIGQNKFGDRGFFGDNWPDRGHHWLPVVDHPSDKASVDFIVIAPFYYAIVANGVKTEESWIDAKRKLTHWHEEVDIPVKVMVVGIARFAVQYVGKVDDISVESWVYPQNREDGFHDYTVALNVLDYFHRHIGPYPYKKLANVQSKTRFGGMENASAIFYAENLINGKGEQEPIIAHEEAHQWFGNSVTEKDWHHAWLSEGFATYFANLYLEYAYGHDRLVDEQKTDRMQVIQYFNENPAPVVDTTVRDLNLILNTNTYQKGGWVLHMLRHQLGDLAFWKGVRQYYTTYRNGNALTSDFQRIMEEVSGTNLSVFFNQWLYQSGHPKLSVTWAFDAKAKALTISISQGQKGTIFKTPLDIAIRTADGKREVQTLSLESKTQKFTLPMASKPLDLSLDPNTWLLFEGKIGEQ